MKNDEVLIKVEGVSKKFCRNLKRSLWYGMADVSRSMLGGKPSLDLRKDEFWAVRDVNFEVRRGECLGLIGHNGAGKSTLLKMLNGLIRPDVGRIEIRGKIGALIELGAGFNPLLTGRENVYNNGAVLGFTKAEIERKFDEIVAFAELKEFIDMPVQNYSSGMKVRLGFAIAAQMEPDILLIDEVLAVGDVGFQVKCFNVIQQIAKNAVVILVSHSMPNIARIADVVCLMNHGEISFIGAEVDKGIASYLNGFTGEDYIVTGNPVRILELKVYRKDDNIEVSNEVYLMPFDSIRISYKVDLDEFSTGLYRIVYLFFDQTLRQFAQYVSEDFQFHEKSGIKNFEVMLNRLNFNTGKYRLGIAFYKIDENKLRIYTYHKNIYNIQFESESNITNALIVVEGAQKIS